jgi:hypothetical protein
VVDKNKYGKFNRYVPSLTRSLTDILNLPSMSMYHPRKRMGHEKVNDNCHNKITIFFFIYIVKKTIFYIKILK